MPGSLVVRDSRLGGYEFDSRLPLGWVTVLGRVNHLSISPSHPDQLSLLPSVGWEMSTSQSAVMLCSWGIKTGMVHYISRESYTTRNVLWSRASVCVCLSVCLLYVRGRMPTLLHGPGCNLWSGRGCPLVMHYWADGFAVGAQVALLWQH